MIETLTYPAPIKRNIWSILREYALQILMYILGTILIGLIWWLLGLIYLGYSLFSNVLYMAWICPYCGRCTSGGSSVWSFSMADRRSRLARTA